ncbi:hypothetical protein [Spirosoma harenae]
MRKSSKLILLHRSTFVSASVMAFTRIIRHCYSKLRQTMSTNQSYLLEALIVLLIMLLLVLGIGWM